MEQGKKFEFSPTLRTLGNHFCQAFGERWFGNKCQQRLLKVNKLDIADRGGGKVNNMSKF